MDFLKKFWPRSFAAETGKQLAVTIVVYVVIGILLGLIGFVLGLLPLVGGILGTIVGIVDYVWGLYAAAGIVFAILKFVKVFK